MYQHNKGEIYWYSYKKRRYGFVVLEIVGNIDDENSIPMYLIAISEELPSTEPKTEDVIKAPLYTLAWFSALDLLPPIRVHFLEQITITDSYLNRAGLWKEEGKFYNRNVGGQSTWNHTYYSYRIPNTIIRDILTNRYVPITYMS